MPLFDSFLPTLRNNHFCTNIVFSCKNQATYEAERTSLIWLHEASITRPSTTHLIYQEEETLIFRISKVG
ncbi:hypothetical protein TanjilG_28102 [Lupinus angustifolius]|uniref:Uncharacterized protein n=1 Tax=Lupinus angustifolius TaxID=3871 RepID=A0A4P1RGQ8_LUPAN|nr:hypothetical protein TanjilG_28102 [Lupinus angustifolius]